MIRSWLAVLALAACSHNSGSGSATLGATHDPPPPTAPTCDVVRDHLISMMSASEHAPQDALDKLGALIRTHCVDDNWSAEARTCIAKATADSAKDCEDLLTQAQKQALESSIEPPPAESAGIAGGGGGGTGAGAPPPAEPSPASTPPPGPPPAKSAPKKASKPPPKKPGARSSDPCEGGQ